MFTTALIIFISVMFIFAFAVVLWEMWVVDRLKFVFTVALLILIVGAIWENIKQ